MSIPTYPAEHGSSVLRFADLEILRYTIPGFEDLPLERKLLIYHLSEAALHGRDITFDQNGRYSLRLRQLFEGLFAHYSGDRECAEFQALVTYLRRLWFSSGIHHHYGSEKFEPDFSEAYLREAIRSTQVSTGRLLHLQGAELDELCRVIFAPEVQPKRTVQSGEGDLVLSSSANFYAEGVTQDEAESYYREAYEELTAEQQQTPPALGLNSRLSKTLDGRLYEEVYSTRGLYAEALEKVCGELELAKAYAESDAQRSCIDSLIRYYRTGDLEAYNRYCIDWVGDTKPQVDFINGFTEVYTDPLGTKGMWESLVHIKDLTASERTSKLCAEAAWFEQHAPIDDRFKKQNPRGVTATVVSVAMLAGDSYPATPIGINLPNADWIRATYGSKSVTIDNIHEAYRLAAQHSGMDEAFIPSAEVRQLLKRYEGETEHLHTDLHECLGHGSGQLLPGVSPDALGAYHSTLEEARADLFALYYMADEKLVSMGLLPDNEAYKACYYRYLLNGLVTQLVRIRPGHNLEEAHMRNRALIARYTLERGQAIGAVELRGLELVIHDYAALRPIIGELLAEIQRIKSEGDQSAGRALIERYAISVDAEMHREILERYERLDIAPYKGFVNPRLELVMESGKPVNVIAHYDEGYDEQMLRYSRDYAHLPLDPSLDYLMNHPEPSDSTLLKAKELRSSLRHAMDGQVAASMRAKGAHYAINFGITLDHLQRLGGKYDRDQDLARYIMSRDVRELQILGGMLYPAEALSFAEATSLGEHVCGNVELRDYLAKHLFDRVDSAPYWAMDWVLSPETSRGTDLRPLAYTVLARHVGRGFALSEAAGHTQLVSRLISDLEAGEADYPTPVQQSALLLLKRWAGRDRRLTEELLRSAILEKWSASSSALQREFADDLRFEFEMMHPDLFPQTNE